MKRIHLVIFNLLAFSCFFLTTANAQTTKKETKNFSATQDVNIHVNSTHTNVKFETWDRNEVQVTFTLEAEENAEELFEKWTYDATKDGNTITIEAQSNYNFDFNFDFNFDMEDFNSDMQNFNFDMKDFNIDVDNMVNDILEDLNLDDIPPSPFGEDQNFDGDMYRKNPDAYLKKLNDKYNTNVTQQEMDKWLDDVEKWAEDIEIKMDSKSYDFSEMEKQIEEQTKGIEEAVEKWEKENAGKIEEMTKQIEMQMKEMNFEQFEDINYFDQDNSKVKKTILIKMPKNTKLQLNVRYGEVTLAENTRGVNADLNYASLSANTISGSATNISASFAPVYIQHWENGHLNLNHCKDISIKLVDQINLNAEGTDIYIGTLLHSGFIHSTYGDLEIQNLGDNMKNLKLVLDYGDARLNVPSNALDLSYKANQQSALTLPAAYKVTSDAIDGKYRIVQAYNQKQNSGNVLSVRANYGDLIIKQ